MKRVLDFTVADIGHMETFEKTLLEPHNLLRGAHCGATCADARRLRANRAAEGEGAKAKGRDVEAWP